MLKVSGCWKAGWGKRACVFGWGGCMVDISGGCLEGVDLRHFKPWLLSFHRPYQVS